MNSRTRSAAFWALIAALLIAPDFAHLRFKGPGILPEIVLERPKVLAGDEPHYLVMVNSLIQDRDLALENNYLNAIRRHGLDAGADYAGKNFYYRDHMSGPRQPWHWPGMPALIAALVWPLAGTGWVETAALLLSAGATLLGLLGLARLLRALDPRGALGTVALIALGTPLWHYSGRLFTEVYLFALLAWALYFGLVRSRWALAGSLLAIGVTFNIAFILFALSLGLWMLYRRAWRDAIRFGAPFLALGLLAALYYLWLFGMPHFGGPGGTPPSRSWKGRFSETRLLDPELFLYQLGSLLFDPDHGYFPFSPVLIGIVLGIGPSLRRPPLGVLVLMGAVLCLFYSSFLGWWGGYCYAGRYLVSSLPVAAVWLHLGLPRLKHLAFRALAALLIGASVCINAQAAFAPNRFFSEPPWALLYLADRDIFSGGLIYPFQIGLRGGERTGDVKKHTWIVSAPTGTRYRMDAYTEELFFRSGSYEAKYRIRYLGGGRVALTLFQRNRLRSLATLDLAGPTDGIAVQKLRFRVGDLWSSRFFPYRIDPLRLHLIALGTARVELHGIDVVRLGP